MIYTKWLILLLSFLLGGCVTSNNIDDDFGDWTPMTDNSEKRDFIKEYGMLPMNGIYDGMAFWEDSPIYLKPDYSFHWYANKIRLWVPFKTDKWEIAKYELEVDSCEGLKEALLTLKEKVKESASKMIDDEPHMRRNSYVVSPTFYRIKIFPPNMLGSISINSIEWDRVPWIAEAKNVKKVSGACAKSKPKIAKKLRQQ